MFTITIEKLMDIDTNANQSKNSNTKLYLLLALLVLVAAVVAAVLLTHHSKKPATNSTSTNSTSNVAIVAGTSMYLSPASQNVTKGANLTVEVWTDSLSTPVNAVQANLTYTADKLTFVSIDDSSSAFDVKAQDTGASGEVKIGRGSIKPVTGKQLVAKVNFIAASSGKATVDFGSGTALVSSTNNKNIVAQQTGGTYTVQ